MIEESVNRGVLRPQELEAVYAISRAVARTVKTDAVLDQIIQLARPVFIFDNMVLYEQHDSANLEPVYARAIGRGRFREAELAWGEMTANEAVRVGETVLRVEEQFDADEARMGLRYYLGLPLNLGEQMMGALVFIRFGGPPYTPDQIHLAEFIAVHISQLLTRQQLVDKVASLEAQRRLDHLQDDFIATVSHELLTPLGFIKGYATTLLRDDITWDDGTSREFLTIIDEEADRLRELIDNLMDSSRLQAGTMRINFQPVRLEALVRDISLRASSRHEDMKINIISNAPGIQIQGDPSRLAQVFDNLLGNAAKYASGSAIDITLNGGEDHFACIQIQDRGPGIAKEHLPHLFKRFYRVPGKSSAVRGTGLGLYICRQIVQAHHGSISVESTLGKGTVFTILLPVEHKHAEETHSAMEA